MGLTIKRRPLNPVRCEKGHEPRDVDFVPFEVVRVGSPVAAIRPFRPGVNQGGIRRELPDVTMKNLFLVLLEPGQRARVPDGRRKVWRRLSFEDHEVIPFRDLGGPA